MKSIKVFSEEVVKQNLLISRFSKAHLCRSVVKSFLLFVETKGFANAKDIEFNQLSPQLIADYECWLINSGKSYNTISTYIRNLQALYNLAVEMQLTAFDRRMFHGRIKGYRSRHLRVADNEELQQLMGYHIPEGTMDDSSYKDLRKAERLFRLQVSLCGMPFVDLVHLKVEDIIGDRLMYRRQKTGVAVKLQLSTMAMTLIEELRRKDALPGDLLLDVLPSQSSMVTKEGWYEYQKCLTWYNRTLKKVAGMLGVGKGITSYVARHTWADHAQRCGVDTKMIMELLGHSRITTTLYYLRNFDFDNVAKAQRKVMEEIGVFDS